MSWAGVCGSHRVTPSPAAPSNSQSTAVARGLSRWSLTRQEPRIGARVIILQHPDGNPMKFANGSLTSSAGGSLQYGTSTLPGSSGAPVFDAMVARFGDRIVAADGTLDRQAVADIVFPDPEALADAAGV